MIIYCSYFTSELAFVQANTTAISIVNDLINILAYINNNIIACKLTSFACCQQIVPTR